MSALNLFIDQTGNGLLASLVTASPIASQALPLWFGDNVQTTVYFLQRDPNAAGNTTFPFLTQSVAGLIPFLYIDDGTIQGTQNPMASCVTWAPDPTNSFIVGNLSLNTPGLQARIGGGNSTNAWLTVGYQTIVGPVTNTTTALKVPINIGVGVLNGPLVVPGNTVPLSAQAAAATYVPINPIPGQPIYLASLAGKLLQLAYVDNGDGTATLQETPLN